MFVVVAFYLQYLDCEQEAEEQLVRLEQAPAHVYVHCRREAVVQAAQTPLEVRGRRSLPDRLAEQRAEPRQGVLVHWIDLHAAIGSGSGLVKHMFVK